MNRLFYTHTNEEVSPDELPQWAIKLTAIAAVLVVSILCIAARKLGTRVAVVFTTLKVAALVRALPIFHCYETVLTIPVDSRHDFGDHTNSEREGNELIEGSHLRGIKS